MTWFRRSVHPEDDLSAYADGELGERARRAVETHLASCEACSTLLRELQDTKSLLSELPRLESRRSFVLGPQYAVQRQAAPQRRSFTFAPVAALTVLVALLFVDLADFSSSGSSDDAGFSTAASTASRQADAGIGAAGAEKAPEAPNVAGGVTSDSGGAAASGAASSAPADASGAPAADGAAGAPATNSAAAASEPASASALAPSVQATPEEAAATLAVEAYGDEETTAADAVAPQDQDAFESQPGLAADDSGGLSTIRILEIVAAIAFAASLIVVFLPAFRRREER
jgi:anti-sigma factor RsiW